MFSSSRQNDTPYLLADKGICEIGQMTCGPCNNTRGTCIGSQDGTGSGHYRLYVPRVHSLTDSAAEDRYRYDFGAGYNWMVAEWPYVTGGSTVVFPGRTTLHFSWSNDTDSYTGEIDHQLVFDRTSNVFRLTDRDGNLWEFRGSLPGTFAIGRFQKVTRPDGATTEVTGYTAAGHLSGLVTTYESGGVSMTQSCTYSYEACPDGAERLATLTVSRGVVGGSDQTQRRVSYTYYGGFGTVDPEYDVTTNPCASGESYGYMGDLKTAVHEVYEEEDWVAEGTHYYRYYTNSHALKFVVEPQQFEALSADPEVTDPLSVSDEKLAEYATKRFEYDDDDEVSKMTSVGDYQSDFVSQSGSQADDNTNHYKLKTTETKPDGGKQTVYTNYKGQVLLSSFENCVTGEVSYDFYQYDSNGNLTLHATPSSLSGYSVSGYAITPTYKSSAGQYTVGLVHVYTYYDETDTDLGGHSVEGYKEYDKVQQGRDGTPINVRKYEYTERAATVDLPGSESSSSSSSSSGDEPIDLTVYPVAKEIAYPNEDGSSPIETSYAYTWYTDSVQMQQRTTTLPAVSTGQNGSGASATRVERFDELGRLVWTKDERGYISYRTYDLASGNVTQSIEDVDDTQLTVPSGWSTPADGGKHLVTDFEYDNLDRLTQTLGPAHDVSGTTVRTASWTVYKTADRETRSAQGYAVSDGQGGYTYTLVNPVQISKTNATGTRSESITAVRTSTSGKLTSSDTFAQSSYVRWSVSLSNNAGQVTATRAYHTIPTSGDGSSGTNYDETTLAYDAAGRQNKSVTPGGTISRTVFDTRGQAVAQYVGTDDSGATDADPTGAGGDPHLVLCASGYSSSSSSSTSTPTSNETNNMVLVLEREYCDGSAGCSCGAGGAGQLVSETRHVDALTWHTTDYQYDWRGRTTQVYPPADDSGRTVYTQTTYDNFDRAVRQERYLELTGSADRLLARSESYYDDRGRVYQTKQYAVDASDGTVGNSLVSNTWYDAAGNTIKQQPAGSQAFTKTAYDSLGRAVTQYVGYDTDETAYADASSVSDDTIVEQSETTFDDAGSVLMSVTRQRFHNATGTGELATPSGSQPKARVTYAAMYYDEIGRQVATANYGTYGGATFSRAAIVPTRTDTILVTSTEYDDAGQAYKTTDPAGREDRQLFDDLGRVTKTIQNYTDGDPTTGGSDEDVTVEMTYNADGNLETLTAKNPTTGDQTTTYVYGTTLSDSEIATSTLKRAEIYPDSDDTVALGDGTDSTYDRIEFQYDRQQRIIEVKDQQETVHAFDFDALGRQTQDRVTTLGSGVDDAVRRISTTYDVLGRREKITSYDNPTVGSGSIVNQVQSVYNDFGQLVTEYQEHDGAVDTSTSLKVEYSYADGSSNTIRLTKMTYPDGRELNYDYGSAGSTDDALSRVASLIDDDGTTHLVDYSYLGRNTFVQTDYPEPDLRYDLAMGAGDDPYDGFDRFGRIVDSRWYDYGSSADVDRILYGYDRASNRTYREQTCDSNSYHDEVYGYDGVNRLTDFDRGVINANKGAISSLKFAQEWSLDPTGNWSAFKEDDDGDSTWDLEQARTSNAVNEITDVTETSGPAWVTPVYNRAGNMTTIPKPADPTSSFAATYDAWNRLVKLEDGEDTVAECVYDGVKRRIVQKSYTSGTLSETRSFYHSSQWQVIEERVGAIVDMQFVWGLRYIDEIVLRDRDGDSDGVMDERRYALQDANWNVTALADNNGDVQERYAYTAYGTRAILTPTFAARASSECDWQIQFAGYRYDAATGLYHVRHRMYQPQLGCWVQRDPIGYADGPNLPGYATGNPLTFSDHTGTQIWWGRPFGQCGVGFWSQYVNAIPHFRPNYRQPNTMVMYGRFANRIAFNSGKAPYGKPYCCECCQYRQFVRGSMRVDDKYVFPEVGFGLHLSSGVFVEDTLVRNGRLDRYGGRRDLWRRGWDWYYDLGMPSGARSPNAASGCNYANVDEPFLTIPDYKRARRVTIDLKFRGMVVDTCKCEGLEPPVPTRPCFYEGCIVSQFDWTFLIDLDSKELMTSLVDSQHGRWPSPTWPVVLK